MMIDLSAFYTATHEGGDQADRPSPDTIRALAAEIWSDPEAGYGFCDLIAIGGMGAVLRMWDPRAEREVAMKVMLRPDAPHRIARFLREARLTAALDHTGIVAVHDIGITPLGDPYFTMKLIAGVSLDRRISAWSHLSPAERPPLAERLRIVRNACLAISYAHDRGVIHLDLKPHNIMVGNFGEVVVIDWGVAQTADGDDAAADIEAGTVLGTPGFMAPEQAAAQGGRLDARTDVYALGAIAYSVAVLKPPIVGDSVSQVLDHNRSGSVVSPFRRAGVPKGLSKVIMKAMAPDPADRYDSVAAFVADLDAWEGGRPLAAGSMPIFERAAIWLRRHRLALRLVVGGSILAALIAIVMVAQLQTERDKASAGYSAALSAERLARQQLQAAEAARRNAEAATANAEANLYLAELRLAQQHLKEAKNAAARAALLHCPPTLREWEWYWLWRQIEALQPGAANLGPASAVKCNGRTCAFLEKGELRVWKPGAESIARYHVPENLTQLSIPPDGQLALLFNAGGGMSLYGLDNGRPVWNSARGPVAAVAAVALGDGQHLAVAVGSDIIQWDMPADRQTATLRGHESPIRTLIAVGDGRRILSTGNEGDIRLWDVAAGRLVRRYPVNIGPISSLQFDPARRFLLALGTDRAAAILELHSGKVVRLRLQSQLIAAAAFSQDGRLLALLGKEGTCDLWSIEQQMSIARQRLTSGSPPVAAAWADNRLVVVAADGSWGSWRPEASDYRVPHGLAEPPAHAQWHMAIAASGRQCLVAAGSYLYLDERSIESPGRVMRAPAMVTGMAADSSGYLILCGNGDVCRVDPAAVSVRKVAATDPQFTVAAVLPDRVLWCTADGRGWQMSLLSEVPNKQPVPSIDNAVSIRSNGAGSAIAVIAGGIVRMVSFSSDGSSCEMLPVFENGIIHAANQRDGVKWIELSETQATINRNIDKKGTVSIKGSYLDAAFFGNKRILLLDRDGSVNILTEAGENLLRVPGSGGMEKGRLIVNDRDFGTVGSDGECRLWSIGIKGTD